MDEDLLKTKEHSLMDDVLLVLKQNYRLFGKFKVMDLIEDAKKEVCDLKSKLLLEKKMILEQREVAIQEKDEFIANYLQNKKTNLQKSTEILNEFIQNPKDEVELEFFCLISYVFKNNTWKQKLEQELRFDNVYSFEYLNSFPKLCELIAKIEKPKDLDFFEFVKTLTQNLPIQRAKSIFQNCTERQKQLISSAIIVNCLNLIQVDLFSQPNSSFLTNYSCYLDLCCFLAKNLVLDEETLMFIQSKLHSWPVGIYFHLTSRKIIQDFEQNKSFKNLKEKLSFLKSLNLKILNHRIYKLSCQLCMRHSQLNLTSCRHAVSTFKEVSSVYETNCLLIFRQKCIDYCVTELFKTIIPILNCSKSISGQYRGSNKEVKEPSSFIPCVFDCVREFQKQGEFDEVVVKVCEKTVSYYAQLISQAMETLSKTEESLKRLNREPTEHKIRQQYKIDAMALSKHVLDFKVDEVVIAELKQFY